MSTLTIDLKRRLPRKGKVRPDCGQKSSGIGLSKLWGPLLLDGGEPAHLEVKIPASEKKPRRRPQETQRTILAGQRPRRGKRGRDAKARVQDAPEQGLAPGVGRELTPEVHPVNAPDASIEAGPPVHMEDTPDQGLPPEVHPVNAPDASIEASQPDRVEDTTESGLAPEMDSKRFLEVYPVNAPCAYVGIVASQPHTYEVCEISLTKGEEELLKEIKSWFYEAINLDFASLDKPEDFLRQKVEGITRDFGIRLTPLSMERVMYYVVRDLIGYGRLDPILSDKRAEDISADGPGIPVFVYHQKYGSLETNVTFSQKELDSLVYKLAQRSGRHISMAKPLLDASLPNHDRLQLSIGSQVTTRGSTFTIRKFRETPFTPIDLISLGTISVEMAVYLWMAVENGFNILIAGGTASGKTTFLNTISMFIPPSSKVVSIEDTREINLAHQNWIPSVTKETEERGSIEMFDLLRTALRQRPEYLLVGEVRGREASTLFQAMATGHITFSTVHADSVESLVKRLTKPPIDVQLMLLDSIDIVALVSMVKVGDVRARRCTSLTEVTGVDFEKGTLKTREVFRHANNNFQFSGESKVFLETMEKLNMSEEELATEYARRLRIMNLLCKNKVSDFSRLSRLLFDYSVHPDEVEKSLLQGGVP